MGPRVEKLEQIARELRRMIFRAVYNGGGGHLGASFSAVEILTALYFGVLKYDPKDPAKPDRDRFILSKGHASAALYAVLAKAGYFDEKILDAYCQEGSILGGHPRMDEIPGVEATTGALGHGFPFALGIALAGKMDGKNYRVYALLGDGECQEGSVWEAALFAAHGRLGNFTAIVDYNKLQAMDRLDSIVGMEPFADKWRSFGWEVTELDGHDLESLVQTLGRTTEPGGSPRVVIAHTTKGKGVSFMENAPLWHYRLPNQDELPIVLDELGFGTEGRVL